ncbi:unannotated protein [freshwater metagenome]|uniref:Unannotated protein n=1 Tax=freshwater metagenome TaxID=449393 RepID=A0A6J6TKA8_9ZZZZ|nr:DoxX family membrane protein [Actinomycetota bacterium]MSX85654.1 DoxX family membrane protein [Actinomycetota bacterium]MSZ00471.1 DoxX family membrane protein [Actinomycetota bacterium]
MDIVLVIGRILFALIFVNSGLMHFTKSSAMVGYAQYKKLPAAKIAVPLSGLMILVGGLYVALGIYADLGALLIAIFCLVSAFTMHNFWTIDDATAKQGETASFFKNLSLAGAALIIFVLVGSGADIGASITGAFFSL